MTDSPTFDPAQLDALAEAKAAEKMEQLKANLVTSLSGQPTEKPPESWSALKNETVDMAVTKAEERILSKIEQDNKTKAEAAQAETQKTQAQIELDQRKEWETMSSQWRDAVADGILPDIAAPIKEKLNTGVGYDKLTKEEQQDAGLVAYNDARALYLAERKEGKSSSLYRSVLKAKEARPAGASAPVFGSSRASTPKQGYTYDEIHKENQANSKFRF